jgi:hypothetical protein
MIATDPPRKPNGGKRAGAGRKPNPPATSISKAELARVGATGTTAAEMARAHDARMVAVLLSVAEHGTGETARVLAAKALLAMGKDAPTQRVMTESERNWSELLGDPTN